MAIVYRKSDDVKLTAPSMLFIGGVGTGKTTIIGKAATYLKKLRGGDFLVINCAPKEKSLTPALVKSGALVVDQPTWVEIAEIMTGDYTKFTAGIAIDEVSGYAKSAMYQLANVNERLPVNQLNLPDFKLNQYIWTVWGERLRNHFNLIVQRGIPLIVTGHIKFDKDELSGEIFKSVNLWGKPAVDIPALFTVCGIMNYAPGNPETWEVKLRPERGFPARDTLGKLSPIEPADYGHIYCKLTDTACSCIGCTKPQAKVAPGVSKP